CVPLNITSCHTICQAYAHLAYCHWHLTISESQSGHDCRREEDGTGLGPGDWHSIANEHGVSIYARSQPEKGATLFVESPKNK
ncbi:hypothetical protein ACFLWI_08785, partial [Chloroflexota bacterium]